MKESEQKFNVGGLNASENVVAQHRHQDIYDMINEYLDRAMATILPGHTVLDAHIILVYAY